MQQTRSPVDLVRIRLVSLLEFGRPRRIQLLQALQGGRDFLPVAGPNASGPQLEPALGERRLEADCFAVCRDRPVEPLGIAIGLPEVKEGDERRSSNDAGALEGADGLSRLACLAVGLPSRFQAPMSSGLRWTTGRSKAIAFEYSPRRYKA